MAAKKTTKKVSKKSTKPAKKAVVKTSVSKKAKSTKSVYSKIFENFRIGESYTSLILGIIAVIILTILVISIFSNRQGNKYGEPTPTIADVDSMNISDSKPKIGQTYTVVAGDTLWSISEKAYGSGYNWVDIANENKLANPGLIFAGNKLMLPSVKLKDATVMTGEDEAVVSRTMRIADETYTVIKGDDLWSIAVRSYGDGYKWTEIAKANNLTNPNFIHPGNVLKIPRN